MVNFLGQCPICIGLGLRSFVESPNCQSLSFAYEFVYDTAGGFHPAIGYTACDYTCSRGHSFRVILPQPGIDPRTLFGPVVTTTSR